MAGLPAGRLQLVGQRVVRAGRRRHPVPQRPVPVHQTRRPLVQPAPPGRAQIAIHSPPHQQMGEPDPGQAPARLLGQDPRRHRFPQPRQRITQAGQRGRRRQLAVVAQHRRRHHQLPGSRAQRAHPQQHHPGQRTRHTQRPAEPVKALDPELLQHRPAVQRVTARLLQQTAGGAPRQLAQPQRPAQRHHVLRPQASEAEPAGPVVPRKETQPPLAQPGQLARAGRHHHQHPVRLQTAHREQQRPRRRPIRPLQIIDQRQHHPWELAQPHHQVGAHRQRVNPVAQLRGQQPRRAAPRPPGAGHQLTHHSIGQQQLRLVTASAQHRRAGQPRREPGQQGRLAGARLPLDQHHPGLAAARRRRSRLQHGQLTRPANKHPPASSHGGRRRPAVGKGQHSPPRRRAEPGGRQSDRAAHAKRPLRHHAIPRAVPGAGGGVPVL